MSKDEASTENASASRKRRKLGMSRRTFMWLGGAGGLGALLWGRFGCYSFDGWDGEVLAKWEAHTVAAAALALIPDEPGQWPSQGPTPMEVAGNVDRFLVGMPRHMLREIRGMFALFEQGTILGGRLRRLSRLSAEKRLDVLLRVRDRGGQLGLAFEGIRSLCYVGWYQDDQTWKGLGYDGLMLVRSTPPRVPKPEDSAPYQDLVAKPGAMPRGVL